MRVNLNLTNENKGLRTLRAAAAGLAMAIAAAAPGVQAQQAAPAAAPAPGTPTFADLATLAEQSEFVIRAEIRDQITVKPERAPGLAPGFARLYIEGETRALLAGKTGLRESLTWLVDVPLTAKGKAPKLKNSEVLLFADSVPGRPGTLVLVDEEAQRPYSPALEARLRSVLTQLVAPDAPPVITGVAEALSVRGNLAGESETQLFLETEGSSPVSITVLRRPGREPVWGVSWGEIIDASARAPEKGTLRWYRLACALPDTLPSSANLARDPETRALAEADYAFVMAQLGECERAITEAD